MYRGGKICLTIHFKPLWAKNRCVGVHTWGVLVRADMGMGMMQRAATAHCPLTSPCLTLWAMLDTALPHP